MEQLLRALLERWQIEGEVAWEVKRLCHQVTAVAEHPRWRRAERALGVPSVKYLALIDLATARAGRSSSPTWLTTRSQRGLSAAATKSEVCWSRDAIVEFIS